MRKLLAFLVLTVSATAQNVTVDGNTTFQTMAGIGINVNKDMWLSGNLGPALDLYAQTNGASLYRIIVECYDWVCPLGSGCNTKSSAESQLSLMNTEAINRSSNPGYSIPTLTTWYEASAMTDLWNTIARLNQNGITGNQIIVNPQGWTTQWLGGDGQFASTPANKINSGQENDYAEMVATLIFYGKVVRGLNFNIFDPLNEPTNGDSREGPTVSSGQAETIYTDIVNDLSNYGITTFNLQAPSLCCDNPSSDDNTWATAISNNSTAFPHIPHFSLHDYQGTGPGGSPPSSIGGHDWWVTETNSECLPTTSNCDSGTAYPSQGEWTWSDQTGDMMMDHIANGFPATLVWAGTNSYELQESSPVVLNDFYHMLYNSGTGLFTAHKGFYVTAILASGIKPGIVRISATTTLGSNFRVFAFYNSTTGKVSVLGHNKTGSTASVSGKFNNLPTLSTLKFWLTDSGSNNFSAQSNVTVSSQAFSTSIPSDTFFLLATPDPNSGIDAAAQGTASLQGSAVME